MAPEKKITKGFRSNHLVEFDACQSHMQRLGLTDAAASVALGIHGATISGYRKEGKAPRYFLIALEGLVRRQSQTGKIESDAPQIVVIRLNNKEDAAALDLLLERMRLKSVKL